MRPELGGSDAYVAIGASLPQRGVQSALQQQVFQIKISIIVAGLVLSVVSSLVMAKPYKQVSAFDQVPKQIKSNAVLQQYNEQMSGIVKPDEFGTLLTAGLSAKEIVALIAPGEDVRLGTLVGAKAWPYRPNSFIAIALCQNQERI